VWLPFEAVVTAGSIVTIDDCPDPTLIGVMAEVSRVDRGPNMPYRRLYCSEAV
jgi:hypothetical protein